MSCKLGCLGLRTISPEAVGESILKYLMEHGGIYKDMVAVLKSRNISNFYADARVLNKTDSTGGYIHYDFLCDVGRLIGYHADEVGADMLVGLVTTGATLAKLAEEASGIEACYVNLHDEKPAPDRIIGGRKVLIVDDVLTTGGSIRDAVVACEAAGAIVVGAIVLVRRNPKEVAEAEVGLCPDSQKLVALLDIDFEIIVEKADSSSVLLKGTLPIRLDIGYAATDRWPENYPELSYVGQPVFKD